MKTRRPRKPRAKLGTIRKSELIYFRCPECRDMQMDVTYNDYVKCHSRRCERRWFYPQVEVTREEYLINQWGSIAEWEKWAKKFDAHYAAWVKGYEQRKREGKL